MKDIFCAKCQQVTPHKGAVDMNGEFVFTCQNMLTDDTGDAVLNEQGNPVQCDRFIKFPADITVATFNEALAKHQETNIGQVSLEGQEQKLSALLQATEEAKDEAAPAATPEVLPVTEQKSENLIQ